MSAEAYWQHRVRVRAKRLSSFGAKLRYWRARYERLKAAQGSPEQLDAAKREIEALVELVDQTGVLLERAQRGLARAEKHGTAPRILTASEIGLRFVSKFGELGPEKWVTGHHTAGPKDQSAAHAVRLAVTFHHAHAAKGWGGIGYHYMIARDGTLLCLRPTHMKGTHVGQHNSSNVGVVCNGTVGDQPTREQAQTFAWLLANAHTKKLPIAHRTDHPLNKAKRRGHNDWPGHGSNACPGTHKRMYLTGGTSR